MSKNAQQHYYKNNRLQQLRGFCYAAQFGNVTRAAEYMGLTQSSVSLQIKALEDDMGCKLFERNGPKIKLTQDGVNLLEMSLPLIDDIHNLLEQFQKNKQVRTRTEIRIAVNASAKNFLMPPILKDFLQKFPDIRVVLHYTEHPDAMGLLSSGAVDIAILARHDHLPFPKTCEYIPIFYCKPCVITLPDHPLVGRQNLLVSEITRYPLTLPPKELQVIPNLRETFGFKDDNSMQLDFINSETVREYIEEGLVITVAPDVWIRENDCLAATPLSHLFPDIDYGMVRLRQKIMPKKVHDLLDIMIKHSQKRMRLRKSLAN